MTPIFCWFRLICWVRVFWYCSAWAMSLSSSSSLSLTWSSSFWIWACWSFKEERLAASAGTASQGAKTAAVPIPAAAKTAPIFFHLIDKTSLAVRL